MFLEEVTIFLDLWTQDKWGKEVFTQYLRDFTAKKLEVRELLKTELIPDRKYKKQEGMVKAEF